MYICKVNMLTLFSFCLLSPFMFNEPNMNTLKRQINKEIENCAHLNEYGSENIKQYALTNGFYSNRPWLYWVNISEILCRRYDKSGFRSDKLKWCMNYFKNKLHKNTDLCWNNFNIFKNSGIHNISGLVNVYVHSFFIFLRF